MQGHLRPSAAATRRCITCRGGGGGWIAGAFLWGEGEGEALSTRRCITCRERGVDGGGEEVSIYTTCRGGG